MINWAYFASQFRITHFNFDTMNPILEFLYPKLILFALGFLRSLLHRFTATNGSSKGQSNDSQVPLSEEKQDLLNDGFEDKEDVNEAPEFSFTFKFPTFDEFSKTQKDLSQLGVTSEDGFADQECVSEHMMADGLNLKKTVDIEEKEDICTSYQEKIVDGLNSINIEEVEETEEIYTSCRDKIIDGLNLKKIVEDEEKEEIHTSCQEKVIDGLNLKDNVEVEEKEEVYTSCQENLKKTYNNKVYLSPDSPTFDLDLEDGFLSDDYFELDINVEDEHEQKNCTQSANGNDLSNDATNKLESLWEHKELNEQLKVEIKKVKAIGLPTIFEEAESPQKIMEDLKPWKIKDVYQNGGGKMGQVHKFYKSYRERMRKLDTFSYQKLYAIGLLQLKDPLESSSRSSVPDTTTLLTQSLTRNKSKKHENDPTMKFIQELESDLEIVYVGQMCLSWEILRWQYEKALDIWEMDPRGVRRFNDIAGEFQQFQVLMQRFIEDEPFQGPRVQNYAKTRRMYRSLLQVPVIRDDHLKNKKARSEVVCDITSDALVDILEESIRIFWQFVRGDKYKRHTHVEFQRPEDSELFLHLQKDLHKKERKLKEQLRGGNMLKKLRCREDETEDEVVYFFCEVDMKLVSRVLQMSKLTSDQLLWCHNKLSKVSFVNRKIHVEPSFLLFPC